MKQITCTVKQLFDSVSEHENHKFIEREFYVTKSIIKIQNEKHEFVNINSIILKHHPIIKLSFASNDFIQVSENHLIYNNNQLVKACDFKIGDIILKSDGSTEEITNIERYPKEFVYDFNINSDSHLYQTADGIIHHNTGKGKSFLLDAMLGSCIRTNGKAYKVNIENAALYDFTKQIVGEDIADKMILIEPEDGKVISIEKLTDLLNKIIDFQASKKEKDRVNIAVGIDSVTQLTSNKEMEIVSKRTDGKKDKKDLTSPVKMRELFRAIEQRLPFANLTLIGIAQLTANIPASGFTPPGTPTKIPNTKGSGFAFASSLTINMISDKEITSKAGIPIGIKMKMKTMKNRVRYKGRDCWIYFYFNRGIDRLGGLCEMLTKYGVFKALKVSIDKKTGEPKVDKNGEMKMSKVEPLVSGEFPPGTMFEYTTVAGKTLRFKVSEFTKVVDQEGGDEFLRELNVKLNEVYNDMLNEAGINEEEAIYEEDNDYDGDEVVEKEEE